MSNVRGPTSAGNARGKYDPFEDLKNRAREYRTAKGRRQATAEKALFEFIDEVTDAEERMIRRKFGSLTPEEQREAREIMGDDVYDILDGRFGPDPKCHPRPSDHVYETYERNAEFIESLQIPSPVRGPERQRSAAYKTPSGVPRASRREVARVRTEERWRAITDAVGPAETLAQNEARNQKLRRLLPLISRDAASATQAMLLLLLHRVPQPALQERLLDPLWLTVGKVLLLDGPGSWLEAVRRSIALLQSVAEGATPVDEDVGRAVRGLDAVAREAESMLGQLARRRGRPAKASVIGAANLEALELTWRQKGQVLRARGLLRDPHSPENIRKSVLALRRRKKAPAK